MEFFKSLIQKDLDYLNSIKKHIDDIITHPFDKNYQDMSRKEKRAYKRWLNKNNMWDAEIVCENIEKRNKLFYDSI